MINGKNGATNNVVEVKVRGCNEFESVTSPNTVAMSTRIRLHDMARNVNERFDGGCHHVQDHDDLFSGLRWFGSWRGLE